MNRFAWVSPRTLSEAAAAASTTVADAMVAPMDAAGGAAVVKAGGIDLLDLMKQDLLAPGKLVNLGKVPGLDAVVEAPGGGLRIGSMVTLAALAEHPAAHSRYPAVADAARSCASQEIRNAATVGGNLLQRPRCWYFRAGEFHCLRKGGGHCFAIAAENRYHAIFDNHPCAIVHPSTVATALVALEASVELADAKGKARSVPLAEFFVPVARDPRRETTLQPREILAAIRLPALPASARMAHLKLGEKASFDWPLADAAVVLDLSAGGVCSRAAVVLGAAAPVPYRARGAERALLGRRVDDEVAGAAARAALEGATPLSGNAYKLPLFEALVRRAILKAAAAG